MALGYGTGVSYQFTLKGSKTIESEAVVIFTEESGDRDELEARLGAQDHVRVCQTCKLPFEGCPGHFGAIKIPPIPQPMAVQDLRDLLSLMCTTPGCGRLVISHAIRDEYVRAGIHPSMTELKSKISGHDSGFACPHCKHPFRPYIPVPVYVDNEVQSEIIAVFSRSRWSLKSEGRNTRIDVGALDLVDNHEVWNTISGLKTEDCLLAGFHPRFYHPYRFMTEYFPVAPPTARKRVAGGGGHFPNSTKRLHDKMIEKANAVIGRLSSVSMEDLVDDDKKRLVADMESVAIAANLLQYAKGDATTINTKLLGQTRQSATSFMDNLSGKPGIWRKYGLGARNNVCSLAVLTGEPWGTIGTVSFPKVFAMIVHVPVTVTVKNIDVMRALVRNGKSVYPGATMYWRNGIKCFINEDTKEAISASLMPGDIVGRHVLPGDFVLHNRYPSLHEESIDCLMIVVKDGFTMSLPIAACGKKNADFDGDTTQAFFLSSFGISAEAFLLQSNLRQFISAQAGNPIITASTDTITGISALLGVDYLEKREAQYIFRHGYNTQQIELSKDRYTPNEIFSLILPRNFTWIDEDITVINGEIVAGEFAPSMVKDGTNSILRPLSNNLGPYEAMLFLENVTRIAYAANRIIGQSQGEELMLQPADYTRVKNLVDQRIEAIDAYARDVHANKVRASAGMAPEEYFDAVQRVINAQKNSQEINELITTLLRNSIFARNGRLKKNITELVNALASVGQVMVQGKRPELSLAYQSRALPFFPRYLDTATSRGYIREGYEEGKTPISHFFEAQEHRRYLFDKGTSVAVQGYFERRSAKNLLPLHQGYLGETRGDSNAIVAFRYGHLNSDPRHVIPVKVDDWFLSDRDFLRVYDAGVEEEVEQLMTVKADLIEDLSRYSQHTSDTRYSVNTKSAFVSPIDLNALVVKHSPDPGFTTRMSAEDAFNRVHELSARGGGAGTQALATSLWAVVKTLDERFKRAMVNGTAGAFIEETTRRSVDLFKRIYKLKLAVSRLLKFKYTVEACRNLCDEVVYEFQKTLVPAGDNIGLRAALVLTERLTQAQLNAIHGGGSEIGGIANVERIHGIERWVELMGRIGQNSPVTTIVLKGEARFDKAQNLDFTKKINTVRMGDIIYPSPVYVTTDMYGDPNDQAFVEKWINNAPPKLKRQIRAATYSPFKLKLVMNTSSLVLSRIEPADIHMALQRSHGSMVSLFIIEETMEQTTRAYVYFYPGMSEDVVEVVATEITEKLIIQGNGFYKNASVIEQVHEYSKGEDGSLVSRPSYRIEANSIDPKRPNLRSILMMPEVDPTRTFSNALGEMVELFGMEEARARLLEEMYHEASISSSLAVLSKRHFKVFVDYITYRGHFTFLTRYGLRANNDTDIITKLAFEETRRFLRQAIKEGREVDLEGHIARVIYGMKPKNGTGFSTVRLRTSALGSSDKQEAVAELDSLLTGTRKIKKKKKKSSHLARAPTFLEALRDE